MVGAAQGARNHAKYCFGVLRNIVRIREEGGRKNGRHSCILDTNFNCDGALLGCVELEKATNAVA